jgi:hypothetical protein
VIASKTSQDGTSLSITIQATLFDISGKTFKLVPKIEISQSDGTQALAYGIIDKDGTLVKIGYKNRGSDYKYAKATLVLPGFLAASTAVTELRCVVSPTGGHGSNPINEMAMSRLSVITNFSGTSTTVPDTGTYTKVGLVKNPSFIARVNGNLLADNAENPESFDNRLVVTLQNVDSVDSDYTADVVVSTETPLSISQQISDSGLGEKIEAIIHEVEYDAVNDKTLIYLVDYTGAFSSKFTTGEVIINGSTMRINTESPSDGISRLGDNQYSAFSGEILHFLDFDPITRILDRKEKIKFTFDF